METVARLKERLETSSRNTGRAEDAESDLKRVLRQLSSRMGQSFDQHLRWIRASVGQTVRLIPIVEVACINCCLNVQ